MNEQQLLDIVLPLVWLVIPMIGLIGFYKVRTNYKIQQLKVEGKEKKKEESISGGISKMISDAPSQLKQIDSEIATIQQKCKVEGITAEQEKVLLSRLLQERDMLSYAVKYGDLAKPFLKPIDKILNNFIGKIGN